jgi:hypothetical protein
VGSTGEVAGEQQDIDAVLEEVAARTEDDRCGPATRRLLVAVEADGGQLGASPISRGGWHLEDGGSETACSAVTWHMKGPSPVAWRRRLVRTQLR